MNPETRDLRTIELSGWGRYPRRVETVFTPHDIATALPPRDVHMIARGQGRSYGDAAMLDDGLVMLTEELSSFTNFDEATATLTTQAGTTLAKVIEELMPRGWFPVVVPGTKYVSIGGCVAADIHGKNHHRDGTFGAHVSEFELVLADHSRLRCSPELNSDLYWATIGGMGLTGLMTEVSFRLTPVESSYLFVQHHSTDDLNSSFKVLSDKNWDDQYTVAWIDSVAKGTRLGRSILMRGHHAQVGDLPQPFRARPFALHREPLPVPFNFPSWTLNSFSMSAFNGLYYRLQSRKSKPFVAHYDSFFFPLDQIGNWNRIYGKRGFIQYQCVLPLATAYDGIRQILEKLAKARRSSFLSVLKRFGPEGKGLLSFPFEGYTLTLDLPVSDSKLFSLLDQLDEIVLSNGGRVYLAKDARLKPDTFAAMYPRLEEWQKIKNKFDPQNCFDSDLAHRLQIGVMSHR